ncbi:AMP-binding protein [Nocardia jiangxiensis]|uniref:AMP-binding protein n=1 Tax=Nocardia jiangxiensis TaxID=282685 RepID=UPI0002DAE636|nr:AMP-binding protein [Nocardia jiangxiensis]
MALTREQRDEDLKWLRERWYREGHYSSHTLPATLDKACVEFADAQFVFASEAERVVLSLAEIVDQGRRVAGGLRRLGVRPGDVVAVQVPNRPELMASIFGTWLAGAVLIPITHIYGPAELSAIIRDAGAKVLVVPDAWRSIDFLDRLARLDVGPSLEHTVVIGSRSVPGSVPWSELIAEDDGDESPVSVNADDVCAVIYTSGTTGVPKGVQHTHNSLLCELRKGDRMNELEREDSRLIPWPSGHVAGLLAVCGAITSGVGTVLMDRWQDALAVELIEQYRCTITSGTPLHVGAILDVAAATGRDISSLRFVQVGGTNVAPALVERADNAGIVVARAYGSTEHPRCATSPLDASVAKRTRTDGMVRFGDEVQIVGGDFNPVPVGSEGEIVTRGPSRFLGYRDPSHDESAFLPGGWFRTGDIGRLDAEGYLTVTDRLKDIIIRGGENIASKEVEDILATHPRVQMVAVVAEPDAKYGERVAAFLVLHDDGTLELPEVRELFARAGAAPQKAPERLEVVTELPLAPSGKIRKFELRDRLHAEARIRSSVPD